MEQSTPPVDSPAHDPVVRPVLLPLWLIVRPGLFFRAWGQRAPIGWVLLAGWVVGIGGMASSVINRLATSPQLLPLQIDSWWLLWVVLLVTGTLRGLGIYWIGGALFRLRLWLSGERSGCWKRSVRVYLGGRLVESSVGVLGIVAAMVQYNTLGDFVQGQRAWWLVLLGAAALVWGGVVSFLGARAVFRLNDWAWLWLFALPLLWRITLLGIGAWIALLGGLPPLGADDRADSSWQEPGTFTHRGAMVSVALADGWTATDLDDGVEATSPDGSVRWSMRFVPTGSAEELLADALPEGASMSYQIEGLTGRWHGVRRSFEHEGTTYMLVECDLDRDRSAVFVASAPASDWENAYEDIERCMASSYVTAERVVGIDPGDVRTIDLVAVTFDVPASWIVKEYRDVDAGYNTDLFQVSVKSPGQAEMYVLVFGNDQSRAESFERSWKEIQGWHRFTRSSRITKWRGYDCDGITASGTTRRGMPIKLTLVTIELDQGIKADVVTLHAPHEPASLLQGVRLFERSIRFTGEPLPARSEAPAAEQP